VTSFVEGRNLITRIPPGGFGAVPVLGAVLPKYAMNTSPLFDPSRSQRSKHALGTSTASARSFPSRVSPQGENALVVAFSLEASRNDLLVKALPVSITSVGSMS
jgi:hypothetical protein